jgi:O-antigen ligase
MTERAVPTRASGLFGRERLSRIADGLVVAVTVSLPWSTSATGILIVLWLLAFIPTIEMAALRREALTWAGAIPVLLWLLAVVGMLWADASLDERLGGLSGFHRLLVIPLLLAQSRRSEIGNRVTIGFLLSAGLLLAASVTHAALFSRFSWIPDKLPGVPVKDYISQSTIFVICIFVLLDAAIDRWRAGRHRSALALVLLAPMFLADMAYIATARTALVVIPVLAVLLGTRHLGWKGLVAALAAVAAVAAALGTTSPYLRYRVQHAYQEARDYAATGAMTSSGLRLEFWRKSIGFVAEAPVLGHGTGSINGLFRSSVVGQGTASAVASENPHQQILTVAIQLGLVGAGLLIAMWVAHIALFSGAGPVPWIGLTVVVQNVVSSQFNSHLFDFTQGWLYVFGVGVIGGMVRRAQSSAAGDSGDLLSEGEPPSPEPYGTYLPDWFDRAIMATTSRLPDNWLGLRLAILLRRFTTMRLPGDCGLDVERFGLKVRLHPRRNGCEKGLLFTPQMYEARERAALAAETDKAAAAGRPFVFVDIGANVGLFSLFVASRIGRDGVILAIEPEPQNIRRLRFNVAANPEVPIRVIATALGEQAGTVVLDIDRRDRGGTRTRFLQDEFLQNEFLQNEFSQNDGRPPNRPSAECRTLLQVLMQEEVHAIDALKIDVEGAENSILSPFFRDAPQSLWPGFIVIEGAGDLRGVAPFSMLMDLGYKITANSKLNVMMCRQCNFA